jgi:hypothetical protein
MLSSNCGPEKYRWALALRALSLFCLAWLMSCSSVTSSDNTTIPEPSYSWRGRILDSVTRAPVGKTALLIREQEALEATGLRPFLDIERFPDNNTFLAEYILHGFRCGGPVDRSFTLHLEVVDSLGRYLPAVHESSWLIDCTQPDKQPLPFPSEDGLVILLQPIQ